MLTPSRGLMIFKGQKDSDYGCKYQRGKLSSTALPKLELYFELLSLKLISSRTTALQIHKDNKTCFLYPDIQKI